MSMETQICDKDNDQYFNNKNQILNKENYIQEAKFKSGYYIRTNNLF